MRLFILGLRRSGTTVFWESFRRDARLVGYDEPFNPLLRELPRPEPKGTRDEFIALLGRDPERFWSLFCPIDRAGELQEGLSDPQRAYLRHLVESAEHVAIDTTRCHFKLAALRETVPDAHVVHLSRPAAAWASSHLAPQRSGLAGRARSIWERRTLFERRTRFGEWGMEEAMGSGPDSLFGRRLAEAGRDPEAIFALPAAGRLLAYWKLHHDRVERDGPRLFGERFTTVAFADFCRDPAATLRRVYTFAGLDAPDLGGFGNVHAPRGACRPGDPRWRRLAERAGIDPDTDAVF
jgi:hypothetical protein